MLEKKPCRWDTDGDVLQCLHNQICALKHLHQVMAVERINNISLQHFH